MGGVFLNVTQSVVSLVCDRRVRETRKESKGERRTQSIECFPSEQWLVNRGKGGNAKTEVN